MKNWFESIQKKEPACILTRRSFTGFEKNSLLKEYVLENGTKIREFFWVPEDHFCVFAGGKYR